MRGMRVCACAAGSVLIGGGAGSGGVAWGQVAEPEVVAYSGMAVPGVEGVTFAYFYDPVMSVRGDIAVWATTGANGAEGGLFVRPAGAAGFIERVHSGDTGPGELGACTFSTTGIARAMNEAGDVLLQGAFPRPGLPTLYAYVVVHPDSSAHAIAWNGALLPNSTEWTISNVAPQTVGDGDGFPAAVSLGGGAVIQVVAHRPTGNPNGENTRATLFVAPGDQEVIGLRSPAGAFSQLWNPWHVTSAGEALMYADPVDQPGHVMLWSPQSGSGTAIVRVGDPLGNNLGSISAIRTAAMNEDGDIAVFAEASFGSPVLLLGSRDGVQPRLWSCPLPPCSSDRPYYIQASTEGAFVTMDQQGTVFWPMQFRRGAGEPLVKGMLELSDGGSPRVAMFSGDAIQGAPAGTRFVLPSFFTETRVLTSQDAGRVVFRGILSGGPLDGLTALATWNSDRDPVLLVYEGQQLEFAPGDVRPISLGTQTPASVSDDHGVLVLARMTEGGQVILHIPIPRASCGDIDFNNDSLYPDVQDIADFLTVFGGGACPALRCDTIDFNRDDITPDTADIESLLSVFSGGACV